LGVNQGCAVGGGYPANGLVETRIGAEPESVQVASQEEIGGSGISLADGQLASGLAKDQFGILPVNLAGLLVGGQGVGEAAFVLGLLPAAKAFIPFAELGRAQARAMLRSERGRVLEVHRHGRQEDGRAGAAAHLDNGPEIAGEVVVHDAQAGAVGRDPMPQKHLHPLPLNRAGRTREQRTQKSPWRGAQSRAISRMTWELIAVIAVFTTSNA